MIIIHTAGNKDIGIGNIIRSKTLGEELISNNKNPVYFICETDITVTNMFAIKGAINHFVPNREEALLIMGDISVSAKSWADNILITDILDLIYEDNIFYKNMGFKYIIQLNDSNVGEFKPDLFINGDAFSREYNFEKSIKILSGVEFYIMKKEIRQVRPIKPWDKDSVKKVLISFGGADPAYYTELITNYLYKNKEFLNIDFSIVLGPAFSSDRISNIKKYEDNNIKFYINPNIKELILINDVVITLGGMTSYEAMCLGKPVGAIGWKYMGYYIRELDKINLLFNLGNGNEALDNLRSFFNNTNVLKQLALNGWKTIDGLGVERIMNFINTEMLGGANYE